MATASQSFTDSRNHAFERWSYRERYVNRSTGWVLDAKTLVATYTGTTLHSVKDRTWVRLDNWRTLKAAGVRLPDNPFTVIVRKNAPLVGSVDSNYTYASPYRSQTKYGPLSLTINANVSFPNRVDVNRVYAKLIQRAKGAQFNAPVFIAESRQTASMVVQRATTIAYGLRALRRGNVDGFLDHMHRSFTPPRRKVTQWKQHLAHAKNSTKGVADIWLEARYGWLPFLSEVRTSSQLLSELMEDQNNIYSRVAAKEKTTWSEINSDLPLVSFGADGGVKVRAESEISEEVKAVWVFMPSDLEGLGRYGLLNPAEVVWELVPFSFVADWFLPIGDYLSYLDVERRFKHVGGTVGIRKEVSTKYSNPRTTSSWTDGTKVHGFNSGSSWAVSTTRTPLTKVPIPSLESFAFDAKINARRVMDSISLIRQFTK